MDVPVLFLDRRARTEIALFLLLTSPRVNAQVSGKDQIAQRSHETRTGRHPALYSGRLPAPRYLPEENTARVILRRVLRVRWGQGEVFIHRRRRQS